MNTRTTRREFLKQAAATTAGLYGLGALAPEVLAEGENKNKGEGRSRIVIAKSKWLAPGEDGTTELKVVRKVLDTALVAFTGARTAEAAWKSLFRPDDVVGLKVNCLFGRNASTRPEVAMAVAEGLQSAGVKPENIIIWDRSNQDLAKAGYLLCTDPGKVQCYGTNGDYDETPTKLGSFNGKLAKILSKKITALVNIPILKDHGIAGITLTMKNHYGSFHNPGQHHGNHCDPYLADLNSVPAIANKTRLVVCDLIKPLANGGPGLHGDYLWDYNGLMIGRDPVALDYIGWQIIEERRKEIGLPTLEQAGRPVRYLATAAAKGLGTMDPAKIELIKVG